MWKPSPTIAVVTRETRLQGLLRRWGTKGAAKFRMKQARVHEAELHGAGAPQAAQALAAAEFGEYEAEEGAQHTALDRLRSDLDLGYPVTFVERGFLPTYDFRSCVVVVVVGQDGLVANTAKYVGEVPIVAVNPDPGRIDGILLPFRLGQARRAVQRVIAGTARLRPVTLAEAQLNDGQQLLAFNDFYIGCDGHISARYTLRVGGRSEAQSSSGMIVSTGAGSTGWLSSVFNMHAGLARWLAEGDTESLHMAWEDVRLAWVVREPFRSKQSGAELVAGLLEEGEELIVESLMPARGVIFSDGVEQDFLEFSSGAIARIRRAPQQARLVVG